MEHSNSPDRPTELVLPPLKPRSPSSVQSSPFSSTISDNELESSFASRPSSCSSSQQNSIISSANQSKLFMSARCSSNPEKVGASDPKVFDRLGVIRSRHNIGDGDSDEDTMDEDSNCSSNEISNISFGGGFLGSKRSNGGANEVAWRSPHETVYGTADTGRKLSGTSVPVRRTTPSPSTSGRSSPVPRGVVAAAAPRSRIASIRRESNCSVETEAAHEKLVKTAQQVSATFDDISIADGERKRTHSLSEPISILTNAFLPHSCSPSPTRPAEIQKQCYSPSTQQVVRNNITYSPSPSPTPSPTRRIMRSLSPIVSRQITKRRYTSSSGMDNESETSSKRVCQVPVLSFNGSGSHSMYERSASFSLPPGDPSSTFRSSLESLSRAFCTPLPPLRSAIELPIERHKTDLGTTAMDSDDCSSTTGGEELFIAEPDMPESLRESKSDTSASFSEADKNGFNEESSNSVNVLNPEGVQNNQ